LEQILCQIASHWRSVVENDFFFEVVDFINDIDVSKGHHALS